MKNPRTTILSLLCGTILIFQSVRSLAVPINSVQMLTPSVGWAASATHLFWTSNTGTGWRDITPKLSRNEGIVSVSFLNASTGWLLLGVGRDDGSVLYELGSTSNGGQTWTITPVSLKGLERYQLSGPAALTFGDTSHGWINFDVVSTSNFRLAVLLMTQDGGKSWRVAPDAPGVSGQIQFLRANEGWLAGGPGGQQMFTTHDGSKTWHKVDLQKPQPVAAAYSAVFGLPVFRDNLHGRVAVTYFMANDTAALGLFVTSDGGRDWSLDRIVSPLPNGYAGIPIPSALTDDTLLTATISDKTKLTLTSTSPDGNTSSVHSQVPLRAASVAKIFFSDPSHGWALMFDGSLFSTADAGASWSEITPLMKPLQK